MQNFPLPGRAADPEAAILEEMDDAREVLHSLSEEYHACENDNYIDRLTAGHGTSSIPTEDRDRRISVK